MLENNWSLQPQDIFKRSPIVPVMVINKIEHAVPLARALVAGGISVLEVTLRTPCALEAITKIAKEVPEALVGAGTILNEAQLDLAIAAGAQFIITLCATVELLKAGMHGPIPLIRGLRAFQK